MFKRLTLVLSSFVVALTIGFTAATPAQAVSPSKANAIRCAEVQKKAVGGFDFTKLNVRAICAPDNSRGVGGWALSDTISVSYGKTKTTLTQIRKAVLHEYVHVVEFRSTDKNGKNYAYARLYRLLGVESNGDYLPYGGYNGMKAWKADPSERLAESLVRCTYGSPNWSGMNLVPKAQCGQLRTLFQQALNEAK